MKKKFFSARNTEVFWKSEHKPRDFFSAGKTSDSEAKPASSFFSKERSQRIQQDKQNRINERKALKEQKKLERIRAREKREQEEKDKAQAKQREIERKKQDRLEAQRLKEEEKTRQKLIKAKRKQIQEAEKEDAQRERRAKRLGYKLRGSRFYSIDSMKKDLQKLIDNKPKPKTEHTTDNITHNEIRSIYAWLHSDSRFSKFGSDMGLLDIMGETKYTIAGYRDGKEVASCSYSESVFQELQKDLSLEKVRQEFKIFEDPRKADIDSFKVLVSSP